MTNTESLASLTALISAIATTIVQALSGVNLGESMYAGLTIGFSSFAVVTGAIVVARSVQNANLRGFTFRRGNLWTFAAILTIASTGLSFYHSWLMIYWAFSDLTGLDGPEVKAAFRNWHILASIMFSIFHLFLYRIMKELHEPDA